MEKKTYYYSRISTVGQNSSRQLSNFKKDKNYQAENVYIDKISGSIPFFQRPLARKLFDETSENSEYTEIIVDSIDRLGRNLIDILNTIKIFTQHKIALTSLKESFTTIDEEGKENPLAKIIIAVMASIAELERDRIKDRQKEGIVIAKANGKYTGRKIGSNQSDDVTLSKHAIVVDKLQRGYTIREIAELTKRSSATIIKVKKMISNR